MKNVTDFLVKHLPKIIFAAVMFVIMWVVLKMWNAWIKK